MEKTFQSENTAYNYTISQGEGRIQALHINLTGLNELTGSESFWNNLNIELQMLDVLHNRLEVLPHRLARFSKSLEVVGCAFNSFFSIPEVFFQCQKLQNINLYHNEVHTVYRRIGSLHCLSLLDLGRNRIEILPDVFSNLPSLQIFVLEGNFLSTLPKSFSHLQSLNTLSLADNMLKEFPSALVGLSALKSLSLHYNRIQHIPGSAFSLICQLQDITLHGNPIQDQILLSMKTEEIQDYLCNQCSSNPLPEVTKSFRILVLGECGSGKTSLVEALCKQKYVAPFKGTFHDHTVGINCYKWPIYCSGKSFDISVWDFGGEKSYSMMNQLFLSDFTLVWIVVNAQTYNYVMSIKSWLNAILSTSEQVKLTIVCTHSDQVDDSECLHQITSDIYARIKMQLEDCTKGCNVKDEFFTHCTVEGESKLIHCAEYLLTNFDIMTVTNAFPLTGHEELRESVKHLIESNLFNLKSPLPTMWVKAESRILEFSQSLIVDGIPPIKKAAEVAKELDGIIDDFTEMQIFLKYLHQAGVILILESPSEEVHKLSNKYNREGHCGTDDSPTSSVVLQPPWLVFVLKSIFRHDFCDILNKPDFRKRITRQAKRHGINLTDDNITHYTQYAKLGLIPSILLRS